METVIDRDKSSSPEKPSKGRNSNGLVTGLICGFCLGVSVCILYSIVNSKKEYISHLEIKVKRQSIELQKYRDQNIEKSGDLFSGGLHAKSKATSAKPKATSAKPAP